SFLALGISLGLILRELSIGFSLWAVLPLTALLVTCFPLLDQLFHGQLNLVLLLLIVGAWTLERSGRPGWAGVLLGVATALKVFPGLLVLYYALRGQRRAVLTAAIPFVTSMGLCGLTPGLDAAG